MRDGEGARFLFRMAKAARKRNAGLTVVTQDAADVLGTDLGQAVVANAATQILLRQAPQAIDAVGDAFGLTAGERRLLLAARRGQGLLIAGAHRTGFEAVASDAEHRLASTDPGSTSPTSRRRTTCEPQPSTRNRTAGTARTACRTRAGVAAGQPGCRGRPRSSNRPRCGSVTGPGWLPSPSSSSSRGSSAGSPWPGGGTPTTRAAHTRSRSRRRPRSTRPARTRCGRTWPAPCPIVAAPPDLRHPACGVAVRVARPAADDRPLGSRHRTRRRGRGRDPRRVARRHPHRRPATPPIPVDVTGCRRRAAAARHCRTGCRSPPTTTPTRCVPFSLPAAGYATTSTPACRSWPDPPGRAGRRRATARRHGCATARPPAPGLDPGAPVRWLLDLFSSSRPHHSRCTSPSVATRRWSATSARSSTKPPIRCGRPVSATPPAPAGDTPRRAARVRSCCDALASAFAVYTGRNRLSHRVRMPPPGARSSRRGVWAAGSSPPPRSWPLLAGLPHDLAVAGLDRARAKAVAPPVAVPTGGRGTKVLGDARRSADTPSPCRSRTPGITCTCVGATGSGKTTLLAEMIVQDIMARRGTVVIDPHGDLVLDVLDRLPATVADRLVLFDPDQPHPAGAQPARRRRPQAAGRQHRRDHGHASSSKRGDRGWTTSCGSRA